MTNEEKVSEIMNFSKFGVLSQVFVMDALQKHADLVISCGDDLIKQEEEGEKNGKFNFISMKGWVGVAKEIKEKLDAQ